MSYVRVESSVRTNKKFLVAGPAPSWLWLCGLMYCQEGLTDGFIPTEALEYLGVKNGRQLAGKLVKARLWETADGGWRVHDYLEHNKSAAAVGAVKAERRRLGADGGKASGAERRNQIASTRSNHVASTGAEANQNDTPKHTSKHASNPYVDVGASDAVAVAVADVLEGGSGETVGGALDVPFEAFRRAYPANRNGASHYAVTLYIDAISSGQTTAAAVLLALENHKASAQWQDESKIPNLQKWLEERRWTVIMPPPKASGVTAKTSGTLESLQRFAAKGSAQ